MDLKIGVITFLLLILINFQLTLILVGFWGADFVVLSP